MNEFYEVKFDDTTCVDSDRSHFFKSKDKAFEYLWQVYLKTWGDCSEEELEDAKYELFNWYSIADVGEVIVRGFDD